MADNLPRSSSTVEVYKFIGGLLEKLENGSLTRETAYSKKRKMAVRYHSEDIEECYHKVRRLNNYATVMTVTDLEKNLDQTQGTPRKKKFDALEDEIIGLQDSEKSQKQIIVFKNEEIRRKDDELRRKDDELRQKDDELRRKDDELSRKDEELSRKDEELSRKDEELDRLRRLLGQG